MKIPNLLAVLVCLFASGCTGVITNTTTSGAAAVEPIWRQQALDNFSKLLDEPNSLPSQALLGAGAMTTTGSMSPSVNFPLSHSVTVSQPSGSSSTSIGAGGASIGGSLGYSLGYQVQAVGDGIGLTNVRAEYMAVLCKSMSADPQWSGDICKDFDLKALFMPPRLVDADNRLKLDPYFLKQPVCVLCQKPEDQSMCPVEVSFRSQLDLGAPFGDDWLAWKPVALIGSSSPRHDPKPSYVYIGESGGREFYARHEGDFAAFLIATLPPTSASSPVRYAYTDANKTGDIITNNCPPKPVVTPPTNPAVPTPKPTPKPTFAPLAVPGSSEQLKTPQLQYQVPLQ